MTALVSVIVLALVLIVLFRMMAEDVDGSADPAPADDTPASPTPPPARPGPPLRPRAPGDASARSTARPASSPPATRPGRTRLFGLGGVDSPGTPHRGPYAVIGYETTGFTPVRDRLVSFAVLHLDADGHVEGRYSTYLSPGPAEVPPHLAHLAPRLHEAPTFARSASHLMALLEGRVVVAHDAEFLEQFLDTHLMEAGVLAPSFPALCTHQLGLTTFPTRNHRLATLAHQVGSTAVVGRSALDDAQVVATALPPILLRHGDRLTYPCVPSGDPGAVVLTNSSTPRPPEGPAPDAWLVDTFARTSGLARELNDTRVARFVDRLVPLLLQGRLVTEEVRGLTRLMVAAGYGAGELRQIQERLLESLRRSAFERGKIGPRALRHLRATATSVGVPGYFDDLIPPEAPPAPEPGSGSFSRPVRKPLPPAPPPQQPRCGHCLQMGHYTSDCPRREQGPVRAVKPI